MALKAATLFLVVFSFSLPALALRCGSDLVTQGDSQSRVLKKCGEPESSFRRTLIRSGGIAVEAHEAARLRYAGFDQASVEVQIEEWEYSFGPRRFGRRVIFQDGRVVKIELMDYDN